MGVKLLMKRKKKITKEKLLELIDKKIYLMTINGKILKTNDYAFIMADTKEHADEYLQELNDQVHLLEDVFRPEFGIKDFDVPDISVLGSLFDYNYSGFLIAIHNYVVPAQCLYECREDVINKIADIYIKGGCLYSPIDSEGKGVPATIGNTYVSFPLFTDKKDLRDKYTNDIAEYTLYKWTAHLPWDANIFSIDGEIVYGCEIKQAILNAWGDTLVDLEGLKQLFISKRPHAYYPNCKEEYAARYKEIPIFFLTRDAVAKFAKSFVPENEYVYEDQRIYKSWEVARISGGCEYLLIEDDESLHLCYIDDLMILCNYLHDDPKRFKYHKEEFLPESIVEWETALSREKYCEKELKRQKRLEEKKIEDLNNPKLAPSAMTVPDNCALADRISELLDFLVKKEKKDTLNRTFFTVPAPKEEITKWEEENGITIPESYKEWLKFTGNCELDGTVAKFTKPADFRDSFDDDNMIVIGEIIGDGGTVCFSKKTGKIVSFCDGFIDRRYSDFDKVLEEVLRLMGKRSFGKGKKKRSYQTEQERINELQKDIDRWRGELDGSEDDEWHLELIEYFEKDIADIKRTTKKDVIRSINMKDAFKTYFKKLKELDPSKKKSYKLQKEKWSRDDMEKNHDFDTAYSNRTYFNTYFFEDMKGTWNDITLFIDGINDSESSMDTFKNAYKKGKETFPDSHSLYIGKAIVGEKDVYGIYLDGYSHYGVHLYNKDTGDKIGFFYNLPEIIASMDLIKE